MMAGSHHGCWEATGTRGEQPEFLCAGGVTIWNPQSGFRLCWTTAGIASESASDRPQDGELWGD